MFPKSMRWRLQAWQGFLLAGILAGLVGTAYELHRNHQFNQIDEELERRIAALGGDVRGPAAPGQPDAPPRFEPGRDGPPFFEHELDGPPSPRPGPDARGPRGGPREEKRKGPNRGAGPDARGPRGRFDDFLESRQIYLAPQTVGLFENTGPNGFYYAIWSRTGRLLKASTNAPLQEPMPARQNAEIRLQPRTLGGNREVYGFTDIGECILVGRPIAAELAGLRRFAWLLVAAGSTVLALGLGGSWLLTSRALRPIAQISGAASRIAGGNLAERIDVAETDSELGRLATVLNSTFARLEAAFAQQRQFTADASHELRTPLAVIISETQTTLARARTAAEYREAVEACLDVAQQMRRLNQSLLDLARYDAGQEPLQRAPFDLAERSLACIQLVRPLAEDRGLRIVCDLQPAPVLGDAERIGQVATNLLTNAIHYNRAQGEVRVATRNEKDAVVLTVADTGPGITAEDLPHVFERFYRGDKSRSSTQGHSGLGLAIVQAIVEAHGGRIEAASEVGVGSTFTVRLPAALTAGTRPAIAPTAKP